MKRSGITATVPQEERIASTLHWLIKEVVQYGMMKSRYVRTCVNSLVSWLRGRSKKTVRR